MATRRRRASRPAVEQAVGGVQLADLPDAAGQVSSWRIDAGIAKKRTPRRSATSCDGPRRPAGLGDLAAGPDRRRAGRPHLAADHRHVGDGVARGAEAVLDGVAHVAHSGARTASASTAVDLERLQRGRTAPAAWGVAARARPRSFGVSG